MSVVNQLWNEHQHLAATAAASLLAAWLLVRLVAGAAMWVRAWRHARRLPGCTGCGSAGVDVVAYPSRTDPQPYCRGCLAAWPAAGPQIPPMVGLRRPVDGWRLAGLGTGMVLAFVTVVVLIALAAGS